MNSKMIGFQYHEYMNLSELRLMPKIKKIKSEHPIVKNNKKSEICRLQGNEYFKDKNYKHALEKYTESLCYAQVDSLEISLAYANRAALLFYKHYYAECLKDIERALKSGYPDEKKAELLDRRQRATKLLSKQKPTIYHGEIPQLQNPNPVIPAMSASIKFSNNEKFGTYIKATRDIQLGEVLLVEKPYAFVVTKEFAQKYCSECGELCFNMIPCNECLTLYCSEDCKIKTFDLYHQYECVVHRYFELNPETYVLPTEILHQTEYDRKIPLRMTIRALKDLAMEKHENHTEYHSDCYEEVKKLKFHEPTNPMQVQYRSTVQSERVLLTFHLLKAHTDLQTKFNVDDKTLRGLLYNNVLIHTLNSAEVVAYGDLEVPQMESFGAGLFPIFSRFNHACCANIKCTYYGAAMVVVASRMIQNGEQCFHDYAGNYMVDPRFKRQLTARFSYSFQCDCKACKEDWPQLVKMKDPMIPGSWFYIELLRPKPRPFDEFVFGELKMLHLMLRAGVVPLEILWVVLLGIYKRLEPEPSVSYGFLELVLAYFLRSCNRCLEF